MKVAVLSLTRDRLDYTKHCFASLRKFAGCDFDHYVLDQGSADGTADWLFEHTKCLLWREKENIGIHRGINRLLSMVWIDDDLSPYDVVVKVDNDCELTVPGTLKAVAEVHAAYPRTMVGPVVNGLRGPMPLGPMRAISRIDPNPALSYGYRIAQTPMIGGIMQPIPRGWRYNESGPIWGTDDGALSEQADWCGQLVDYPVTHYEGTDGQHVRYPEYFERRVAEGGPA